MQRINFKDHTLGVNFGDKNFYEAHIYNDLCTHLYNVLMHS